MSRRCDREGVAWPRPEIGPLVQCGDAGPWCDVLRLRCLWRHLRLDARRGYWLEQHLVILAHLREPVALPSDDAGGAP